MREAIVYARQSVKITDKDSIASQMQDLAAYCDAEGLRIVLCCHDRAVSGSVRLRNRPGLSAALDYLGEDMCLVVRNVNRLSRSVLHALEIEEEIQDRKAEIHSIEDGGRLDSSPTQVFLRVVLYGFAELQRKEIGQRTSRRIKQKKAEGKVGGGQLPFGYERGEDDMLVRSQPEMIILNLISLLYNSENIGCRKIARKLNERGMLTRRGSPWSASSVQHLIDMHVKGAD